MIDTATVLARPEVQKEIGALAALAGGLVGISYSNADRMRIAIVDRLAEGAPVPPAIALVEAIQTAPPFDVDRAVDLLRDTALLMDMRVSVRPAFDDDAKTLRLVAEYFKPGYRLDIEKTPDDFEREDFHAANAEISALESQRETKTACGLCGFPIDSAPCGPDHAALKARFAENNGAGESGGLLNA